MKSILSPSGEFMLTFSGGEIEESEYLSKGCSIVSGDSELQAMHKESADGAEAIRTAHAMKAEEEKQYIQSLEDRIAQLESNVAT